MRLLQCDGQQGRGNPAIPARAPRRAPDLLSYAVADHIRQATPGVRMDLFASAWDQVVAWRLARLVALWTRRQQHEARAL